MKIWYSKGKVIGDMGFQDFVWKGGKEVDELASVPKARIKTSITYLCKFHAKNCDMLDKSGCCKEEEHFEKHFQDHSKIRVAE